MKPAILGLAFLLLLPILHAQTSGPISIPDVVMDQFTLVYPDAEHVQWIEQKDKYLAEFKNYKMNTVVMMSAEGEFLQSETEIKTIALPKEATYYLTEEINAKKIESAVILENESGTITFKAIADKEIYWFDGHGHVYTHGIASNVAENVGGGK